MKELGVGHLKFVSALTNDNRQISFNESMDKSLDWEFLKEIRKITKLPIILKGILSVEDAIRAHEEKIDAIWVSNHGGRQLDSVVSTVEALPPIVSALRSTQSLTQSSIPKSRSMWMEESTKAAMSLSSSPWAPTMCSSAEGWSTA